jgi:methylase of polypeptide subunit release factors
MNPTLVESIEFEGLRIAFDSRVLRPRPWTAEQSRWAARLLADLPPGPVLELCSGAGHIGLATIAGNRRHLVCVDADPVATQFACHNAEVAGLAERVEQRLGLMDEVLLPDETFSLVLADPPWVVSEEVRRYPDDPPFAIDGGPEGLQVARRCWRLMEQHLAENGQALLQLGTIDQVAALVSMGDGSLRSVETRQFDGGVVTRLVHAG